VSGISAVLAGGSGAPGLVNGALPNGSSTNAGSSTFQLVNDGTYVISTSQAGDWVTPATAAVAVFYQVKVDETVGAFDAGTVGSYIDLSTTRTWTDNAPGAPGSAIVTFDLTIREKATGIIRSAQTGLTLEALTI
jgi:hypothetical protein